MLKFLLIVGLVVYVIIKIGSWFYRAGAASQQFRSHNPNNPNMNSQSTTDKKRGSKFNGGEYIDYEEVK
jgi:hypothetical protein